MEPVGVQQFMLATVAAGAVVVFGALYAVFFALSRLRAVPWFGALALAAYGLLASAVILLGVALQVHGVWALLIAALLAGYFVAPRVIWHLSAAVHSAIEEPGQGDRDD